MALTTSRYAYYFDDQLYTSESEFSNHLSVAAQNIALPITLVVQADKDVSEEKLIHLTVLAHGASTNIQELLVATLPRVFDSANGSSRP